MNLTVNLDGRPVQLELEQRGGEWLVNGEPASVVEVEPGVYSVLLRGRSFEARMEPRGETVAVGIGGRRYEAEVIDPRKFRRAGAGIRREGRQQISSPMPGRVVTVLAAVGDLVEAGQGLLVIEAMKMQNELKAARAGRVVSLSAAPGAAVAAGEVLAVIE